MATQNSKKELSQDVRNQIIGAHLSGVSYRKISTMFDVPRSTVSDTVKRYKQTGAAEPVKRLEPKKSLTDRGKRALKRIIASNRRASLGEITAKINTTLGTTYHPDTVRSYIRDIGYRSCIACHKPLLTETHKEQRLKWCDDRKCYVRPENVRSSLHFLTAK